jgi:hypothetical protein
VRSTSTRSTGTRCRERASLGSGAQHPAAGPLNGNGIARPEVGPGSGADPPPPARVAGRLSWPEHRSARGELRSSPAECRSEPGAPSPAPSRRALHEATSAAHEANSAPYQTNDLRTKPLLPPTKRTRPRTRPTIHARSHFSLLTKPTRPRTRPTSHARNHFSLPMDRTGFVRVDYTSSTNRLRRVRKRIRSVGRRSPQQLGALSPD